jgi:hypothetical protein
MVSHIENLMLKHIIQAVTPPEIITALLTSGGTDSVIQFVSNSIQSAPVFVRWPEKILRPCLFALVIALRIARVASGGRLSCHKSLLNLSKAHPLMGDAIRLYLSLSMYAAFEEKAVKDATGLDERLS